MKPYVLTCIILLLLAEMSLAQPVSPNVGGTITGVVKNASGEPLARVFVEVSSSSYREVQNTDRGGRFRFEVPRGVYTVVVQRLGFAPRRFENVRPAPGIPVELDAVLAPIPACTTQPVNPCNCLKEILAMMQSLRDMAESFSDPETLIESIWPEDYWLYGPKSISVSWYQSPGWWFRIYRPDISINQEADRLSIDAKAGVRKTRGALQFGWRVAGHDLDFDLPPEINKYLSLREAAVEDLDVTIGFLTQVCNTVCLVTCSLPSPVRSNPPR